MLLNSDWLGPRFRRLQARCAWHRWFAWYPVPAGFLVMVERRWRYHGYWPVGYWQYRGGE
jgi:hypothetical protein